MELGIETSTTEHVSTVCSQHRQREILLRLGKESQDALHMVHEQHQRVQEGTAQINVVRHQVEMEHQVSLRPVASAEGHT